MDTCILFDPTSTKMLESSSKEELLLYSLVQFFSISNNFRILVPIVTQKTVLSLRILDWFSTNYAKKNAIYINNDIYLDYKRQLKGFSKKQFDPFCRRHRLMIVYDEKELESTDNISLKVFFMNEKASKLAQGGPAEGLSQKDAVAKKSHIITTTGQLNFFRWAIREKVIEFAFKNVKNIESDMIETIGKRTKQNQKGEDRKKRKELSIQKSRGVGVRVMRVTIQFN